MKFAATLLFLVIILTPLPGYAELSGNSSALKVTSNKSSLHNTSITQPKSPDLKLRTVKVDEPFVRECERICRMTKVATDCIRRNCKASITIPAKNELVDRAIHLANAEYKSTYSTIDIQTYLGADDKPISYLVVLGKSNDKLTKSLTKSSILSEILAGKDPVQWDDLVVWFDMSTDPSYPPVRSSGLGVPAEWLAIKRIKQLHQMTGQITKRYFSALSPVLKFTGEQGESFFYQHIMPGKLATNLRFEKSKARQPTLKIKEQWVHFINQANHIERWH